MGDTEDHPESVRRPRTPSLDTTASGYVEPLHISRKVSQQLRALRVDTDSPVCDVIIKTSLSHTHTNAHTHTSTSTDTPTSTHTATSTSTGTDGSNKGAYEAEHTTTGEHTVNDAAGTATGETDAVAANTKLKTTQNNSVEADLVDSTQPTTHSIDTTGTDDCGECREKGLDECHCDTGSVDLDLSDVDRDVADCLFKLNKATEDVDEIEIELYQCKDRLLAVINKGDVNLRYVEGRLGMLKAIERAKTYFKQEQSAVDAKDAAEMADMQLQKVITAYEKARTEQHLCEKQLEKELVGNMAKGASGKQSKGVSVVIDLQVQDALNNAAMCVQECKMELQRVDVEVKLAYKKAKKEIELCESIRITDRGSIDKAQIYYDTRDKILSQIDAAQRELDRKVHEDTRARLKVAQCLQALQNMSHKRREDLNSPTPTSAVEELVTSGLSRMSFSSQRCSQPHNHSLPTHHIHSTIDKHSPVVVGHTTPYTHVDSRTGDRQGNITTLGQTSTNSPHQQAAYNRSLREVGAEESEEDIDITDSPSLLGRVTAGATSPSFSTKSYSHYSRLQ